MAEPYFTLRKQYFTLRKQYFTFPQGKISLGAAEIPFRSAQSEQALRPHIIFLQITEKNALESFTFSFFVVIYA